MNFLSVLKKVGQDVNAASAAVPAYGQLAQIATALTPGDKDDKAVAAGVGVANSLVKFQNIVLEAEVFGQAAGLSGPQKAAGIAPAVVQLFLELPILKGKKAKDPGKTKADAAKLAGALAEFMNGFEG